MRQQPRPAHQHRLQGQQPRRLRLAAHGHEPAERHKARQLPEGPAVRGVTERLHDGAVRRLVGVCALELGPEAGAPRHEPPVARPVERFPQRLAADEGGERLRQRSVVPFARLFGEPHHRRAGPRLLPGGLAPGGMEHEVEHDAVVAWVDVVAVRPPARLLDVNLYVAPDGLTRLFLQHGVPEVRARTPARPAGIEHAKAAAVLGPEALRQVVRVAP